MTNPEISVIMPVYNAEKYIGEAIQSILNQTFKNFELIIIIDGSTDKSENIVKNFSDKRIRYFSFTNKGVSASRNFGISVASGKFIALMDADDISDSERLERQYNFLIENDHIQIVGTNCMLIDQSGRVIAKKKFPEDHEHIEFLAPLFNSICFPSIMVLKENLLKIGGYKEDLIAAGDLELLLRLLLGGFKVKNIQENLYTYRKVSDSISHKYLHIQKSNHYTNALSYLNTPKIVQKDFRNNFRKGLLEYYYGDISRCRKYLLKSLEEKSVSKLKIFRLLLVSILGHRFISLLRAKGVLPQINKMFYAMFRIDFQKVKET
ncbi:MAG: glycosyltransferase family 2 protein [Ignavibacterium sp.]|jgi:glycosyltransferase involved in cell wall biosynthesis|nr:glycosyltransferase family 2 protein [Ignavibacterium sp.]